MKLIILIGLPGSGKSTWAKQYEKENSNCKHIEFDKCCIVEPIYFSLEDAIRGEVSKYSNYDTLIIDFMFYKTKDIITVINSCKDFEINHIELHLWKFDRIQCLINDKIRMIEQKRKYDCSYSIKNKKLDICSLDLFKEKFPNIMFSSEHHEVFKYDEFINKK